MSSQPHPLPDRRALLAGFTALLAAPAASRAQTPAAAPSGVFEVIWRARLAPEQRTALEAWTGRLQVQARKWWPIITTALASPGYVPVKTIPLDITSITPKTIPAATRNGHILVDAPYLLAQIDNFDRLAMVGHEMVHVAQAYPPHAPPWLSEGVADYLRYYVLVPQDLCKAFDPSNLDWWRGYQPTAGFLDWIERKSPGTVKAVNADLRAGGDGIDILKARGGGPLSKLWQAYMDGKPPAATPEAVSACRRSIGIV